MSDRGPLRGCRFVFSFLAMIILTLALSPAVSAQVAGDTNGDGKVDLTDFNNLRNNFGSNYPPADFNQDGKVDLFDFNIIRNNFGTNSNSPIVLIQHNVSRTAFSPNGDGLHDTLTFTSLFSHTANWELTILNSGNTQVRLFTGTGFVPTTVWDGKNTAGTVVPDGNYTYRLTVRNPANNQQVGTAGGTLLVDKVLPAASITSPTANEVFPWGPRPIMGRATDANFVNFKIEYASAESPTVFNPILISETPHNNDLAMAVWYFSEINFGNYTLRLTVRDKADNVRVVSVPVRLDHVPILDINKAPIKINPLVGETAPIRFRLTRTANITIQIIEGDYIFGSVVRTLSFQNQQPRTYDHRWNGKNDNGQYVPFNSSYYFKIFANDGTGRSGEYSPSYIGTEFGGITPPFFDPYKSERAAIKFTLNSPARLDLDIFQAGVPGGFFNLANNKPFLAGENTVYWDGRNGRGQLLPPGSGYDLFYSIVDSLFENAIIIEDDKLDVQDLKTNAYVIVPVFGEVSKIAYELGEAALVTLNIKDPNGSHFKSIYANESQPAGPHEFFWDGTNDDGNFAAAEGHYVLDFTIRHPAHNLTNKRRGMVTVFQ